MVFLIKKLPVLFLLLLLPFNKARIKSVQWGKDKNVSAFISCELTNIAFTLLKSNSTTNGVVSNKAFSNCQSKQLLKMSFSVDKVLNYTLN